MTLIETLIDLFLTAIVLDREYLEEAYEQTLEEIKIILERVVREDLKNGGLVLFYYSWTRINYKKDFTAVFSITRCEDTWNIFKEARDEQLIMIALTEPNCPRLPREKAYMVSTRCTEVYNSFQNILSWVLQRRS